MNYIDISGQFYLHGCPDELKRNKVVCRHVLFVELLHTQLHSFQQIFTIQCSHNRAVGTNFDELRHRNCKIEQICEECSQ